MNNTLILRDYQQDAIDAIWNEILRQQTALCVMSTGLGKTEVLIGLIKKSLALKSDLKVVFLVNKLNLLGQTERRIVENLGDIVGMFYGKEKNLQKNVTVASIQSLHKIDLHVNFLILDEVHNVDQNNGRYLAFIDKCRVSNPKLKIIGVTATAFRADGYIYGPGKMFNRICFDRGLLWAIHNKHLVTPRLKAQSEKFDTSKLRIKMGEYHPTDVLKLTSDEIKIKNQLVSAIPQLIGRKKIVWATSSIEHCRLLFKQLVEMETAAMVHSKQNDEQNAYNIKLFEKGDCTHLVFVTIVSEGYDHKPIVAVVLMRPTRSPVLYVQTIGRGLRPFENKEDCLVLDFGGVVE